MGKNKHLKNPFKSDNEIANTISERLKFYVDYINNGRLNGCILYTDKDFDEFFEKQLARAKEISSRLNKK